MGKTRATHTIALNAAAGVPEWLQLLPATEFSGVDGRGPYMAPDLNALVQSFNAAGRKLAVDENHSTDLAGKAGHPAPARGWIVELQARSDGLYGRVEWTASGRELMEDKAYGFISPVFFHSRSKPHRIASVERVALTNDPNLSFLKSLNAKEDNAMLEELRKALGLSETATETEALEAVKAAHSASGKYAALIKRVGKIAEAEGDEDAVVTALQSRLEATGDEDDLRKQVSSLSATVTDLNGQLTTLKSGHAKERAETVIDAAIGEGKVVPALRDHYIARHQKDAGGVEEELKLLPSIHAGGLGRRKPVEAGATEITADDEQVMALMGVDPEAFKKQREREAR
ncbi:phage protease [Martelella mediterranea]|uniref:Phage I-like protein n=1 Tax=Martelella mediterranea TaxID=293089 RepID=A0A4R3NM95_9HYPH|nr:phage protease [Martelella mediterranea]TCT35381.1 phage I-like protein [Martelella mediterranea]